MQRLEPLAQQQPQLPPFKRYPTLPPLELQTPDNKTLTKADLKKKPTLIMYFSPTCDHCIRQMKDMQKRMKDLSRIQIILATYQPMEELQAFVREDLVLQANFAKMVGIQPQ